MSEIAIRLDEIAMTLIDANGSTDTDLGCLEKQLRELASLIESTEPRGSQALQQAAKLLTQKRPKKGRQADDVMLTALKTVATVQMVIRREISWEEAELPTALGANESARRSKAKQVDSAATSEELAVAKQRSKPTSNPTPAPSSKSSAVDPELLEGFILEAQEHLETADVQLLTLESDPQNEESLSSVFRAFHTIKGVAGFLELHTIGAVAHEAESILVLARDGKMLLTGPVVDAVFAAADMLKQLVSALATGDDLGSDPSLKPTIDALLVTLQRVATQSPDATDEPRSGRNVAASQATVMSPQVSPVEATKPAATSAQAETLRVDRERLDYLVDMIGELVIAEAMVQQDLRVTNCDDVHVGRNLAQLNKITRNLQELSLSLRMVPIRATFQKMARMVRDLSKKLDKPIEFHMVGEETELDKTVVDQIGDPLMHMVRNAVDHGIEPACEQRIDAGKTPHGNVTLRAFHQGGNIYIEIQDDGRGLDPERLRNKARERGILGPDATMSDRELMQLIFHPGFSTAEKVTDVSGRGVGMDVVRRNIESLRGSVDLRSETGRGTCVSMRLPLTLAIIDGMVVSVGQNRYIIPTLSIVELLRPKPDAIRTVTGRGEYFTIRDSHLPLMRVGELFCNYAAVADPAEGIVVVVEDGHFKAGLLVDAVHGQQQAVIKSLGHRLEGQPGVAGGAVMPDGRVGLILDVHGLLELAGPAIAATPS